MSKEYVDTFSIDRGVMNRTKDSKLAFVNSLEEIALEKNVQVVASLGMSAIELLRRGEIIGLTGQYPQITAEAVDDMLEYSQLSATNGLIEYSNFKIGVPRVFTAPMDRPWIGSPVIDGGQEILSHERSVISQILSELADEKIELEPVEHFLNIAVIKDGLDNIQGLLAHVGRNQPEAVNVYDVATRNGAFVVNA